eukprot:TRINITY_DN63146_c0_g1_i1.p1 TRINITY_DN63146_c0_g1~~TRINITY_DN63146_c0_g1_i1.p1  ORF type:complete len:297 (-),score=43.34 TRINITY_DN63146_c0_g1_i1:52-870(-)
MASMVSAHHAGMALPASAFQSAPQPMIPVGELDGTWINADCRWEEYKVHGLQVVRTNAYGSRGFTIRWDPQRLCWEWGTHGRLSLQWLGMDTIAWVPELSLGTWSGRVWRWQRVHTGVTSSSQDEMLGQPRSRRQQSRSRSRRHWHRNRQRRHGSSRRSPDAHLPCGLTHREVYNLLTRDITPEDYDMLLRLDEALPKAAPDADRAERLGALPSVASSDFMGGACSVCLTAFEKHDEVVALPCEHHFHNSCISRWLSEYRQSCPLCCKEVSC